MKNLKAFIIVSVAIHIIGALGFYFYYNPISVGSLSKAGESSESEDFDQALEEALPTPPDTIEESSEEEDLEGLSSEDSLEPRGIFSKMIGFFRGSRSLPAEKAFDGEYSAEELSAESFESDEIDETIAPRPKDKAKSFVEKPEKSSSSIPDSPAQARPKSKKALKAESPTEPTKPTKPTKPTEPSSSQKITTQAKSPANSQTNSQLLSKKAVESKAQQASTPESFESNSKVSSVSQPSPSASPDSQKNSLKNSSATKALSSGGTLPAPSGSTKKSSGSLQTALELSPSSDLELSPQAELELSPSSDLEPSPSVKSGSKPPGDLGKGNLKKTQGKESSQPALPSKEKALEQAPSQKATQALANPAKKAPPSSTSSSPPGKSSASASTKKSSQPLQTALELAPTSPSSPAPSSVKKASSRFKSLSQLRQKAGNPSLKYPDFARRKGQQGEIAVTFYVNSEGLTEQIQLEKSSGHLELDNFVIRHLSKYKFLDQNQWVRFKRNFVLEGQEVERLKLRTLEDPEQKL